MHQRLSLELQQGGVMVMSIRVVIQWRAIERLVVGLLASGIAIAVMSMVHDLKIAGHYPDMVNRHMENQVKASNRSYKRNSLHGSPV